MLALPIGLLAVPGFVVVAVAAPVAGVSMGAGAGAGAAVVAEEAAVAGLPHWRRDPRRDLSRRQE